MLLEKQLYTTEKNNDDKLYKKLIDIIKRLL
jgi:hypothetical protein